MPCPLSGAKGPYLSQEDVHDSNNIFAALRMHDLLVLLSVITLSFFPQG
jgi:hypothetical protein